LHKIANSLPEEMMQEVENWIEAEMRRLDPEAYLQADAQPAKPAF
jgi:1-acyl-sn-glycerol-3-phosphate acyltransferase